jgi:glycerol-3-phosphate dehydrogenase
VRLLNRVANTTAPFHQANDAVVRRLRGRYGIAAPLLINMARPGELEPIPGTQTLWIELRWAAQAEGVVHLDDLLLRRVRLGLLLPNGGSAHLPAIRRLCQPELGWSDEKWEQEEEVYLALIHACYSLPDRSTIPDWHSAPKAARGDKREEP